MPKELTQAQCDNIVVQLDALMQTDKPKLGADAVGAPFWDHIEALKTALKSRDIPAIVRAVRDTLNHFLGEEMIPLFAGQPQAASAALGKIDWKKWLELIITQILPLILR
jgi:hypothetical protein